MFIMQDKMKSKSVGTKNRDIMKEATKMWGMKMTVVPAIVGALGLIKSERNGHVSKIPRWIRIEEIQKIVLLGTSHILRRVSSMTWELNKLVSLGAMVWSRPL